MAADQSLSELLQERVALFANSNRPAEIIDEYTEKMFEEVIKDQFRSYGDMNKAVAEAVRNALPGNISKDFELTRYNNLITNALREKWESSTITSEMVKRANQAMDEALEEITMPEIVSLRAILDAFIEHNHEEALEDRWESPDIRIDESESARGYFHIYFDKTPESDGSRFSSRSRSVYELDNSLAVIIKNDEKTESGQPIGRVYAAKVDGDLMCRKYTPYLSGYEKLMVAMYYGGAKLAIDCEADDFYYPGYD